MRSGSEPKTNDTSSVSYLDQALWKRFKDAETAEEFALSWLTLQCTMIHGVSHGLVVLFNEDKGHYQPVAQWPAEKNLSPELSAASELALRERQGVVNKFTANSHDGGNEEFACIAYPFMVDDWAYGVVAIEVGQRTENQLRAIMRQLQWGSIWFETQYRRELPHRLNEVKDRLATVLDLMATAMEHTKFQAASSAVAAQLATYFKCDRVSIGLLKGNHIRVRAVSNTADFNKQTNMVRAIGNAMDEAMDQNAIINYPAGFGDGLRVNHVHQALTELSGAYGACSIPLSENGKIIGALTLEYDEHNALDEKSIHLCEQVSFLLGPLLEIKRKEDRLLFFKAWESGITTGKQLLGAGHFTLKTVTLVLTALLLFLTFVPGTYRISSEALLEGWTQRVITAPMQGYISSSEVRAGDTVKSGQLLFTLDDRDLKLEQVKLRTEREQVHKQYRDALSQRDRANVGILKAKLDQAEAELNLVKEQLERSRAYAPYDGIVIDGDLSQMLGAPVEQGKTLMMVAPLDQYRILLNVEEYDIADVSMEQAGELTLSAMPDASFPFVVEKITPVSEAADGVNYFRVEARLQETSPLMRPGMQGSGKIHVGERKLVWIWTHRFIDWVRLWFWSWWP